MTTSPEPEGVLPVDKPVGPTSHDVVRAARRALGMRRIGHTGTLDPFASGLLLLCLGRATRIAEYLTAQPKRYRALLRLGAATDTDDCDGVVTAETEGWRELIEADIRTALARRQGRQLQVPPAYSAKKVAGERLYERARRGEHVDAEPVEVEVHEIALTHWAPPLVEFETTCSSGTYIRAIARDVGNDLGVYGHLAALRRTASGDLRVEQAIGIDAFGDRDAVEAALLPVTAALAHLPAAALGEREANLVRHGRSVPVPLADAPVVVLTAAGRLLAIAAVQQGQAQPRKVFSDE